MRFIFVLLAFWPVLLFGQEAVSTTGGDIQGNGSASYTVGQTFFINLTGPTGNVEQGVQHAYEITTVSVKENSPLVTLTLLAYPNPVVDFLNLKVENFQNEEMSYQLIDMAGKMIRTEKIQQAETQISMQHLATAIYFVRVIMNSEPIKTFKIIKR